MLHTVGRSEIKVVKVWRNIAQNSKTKNVDKKKQSSLKNYFIHILTFLNQYNKHIPGAGFSCRVEDP